VGVYTLISICCVLGYRWAGMTWLDAIMHMFSTMGLGGFSSHDASFGFLRFAGDRSGEHRSSC
jgi:trk system potassium uptake protein TrkH